MTRRRTLPPTNRHSADTAVWHVAATTLPGALRGIVTVAVLCILTLLQTACKPELPAGVISERRMEQILHDYHIAQGMAENAPRPDDVTTDMLLYDYQHAVFRKYGITEEEFERSMAYYCSDMPKMTRIYKNVTTRLEREAEALGIQAADTPHDAYANLTENGDTANVWADRMLVTLKPIPLENFYTWQIDADSTWQPGDDLYWRFQMIQLSQGGMSPLTVDMEVTYTNDSVRSVITHITTNPVVELRIKSPIDWMPREITGHAYLAVMPGEKDYRLMIVHHPLLARMHKPESERKAAIAADTITADTIAADTIAADTVNDPDAGRRLSPTEFLNKQDVERTINVVKEQPFDPSKQKRGYPQRRRRRQR